MKFLNPYAEIDMHANHLPHWQQDEAFVFATWRLADSLPQAKVSEWMEQRDMWTKHHPTPWDEETEREYHKLFSPKLDEWLDEGCGSCVLKEPANAGIVTDALRHFDGDRYALDSFVVMPNHVHVLFCPFVGRKLADVVQSWKGFSAREINKRMGSRGSLWQEDYWDRVVRTSATCSSAGNTFEAIRKRRSCAMESLCCLRRSLENRSGDIPVPDGGWKAPAPLDGKSKG